MEYTGNGSLWTVHKREELIDCPFFSSSIQRKEFYVNQLPVSYTGNSWIRVQKTERSGRTEIYYLESKAQRVKCPSCGSWHTRVCRTRKSRDIRGLSIGFKQTIMRVAIRRIICEDCKKSSREPITFCPKSHVGYTKWLARFVLALRTEMSISAVAEFTGLHWGTVKDIEKQWLRKKYRTVSLRDVEYLGIDEVYLGPVMKFITVARDLDSGAVLYVGKGKGAEALRMFRKRLRSRSKQIKAVTIDMANSYAKWIRDVLPNADIVYDHFHVIKLMNERMNSLRNQTLKKLTGEQKNELKGTRSLFLRNQEDLSLHAVDRLKKLRFEYRDLGTASFMKECLRNIYKMATDSELARRAFMLWCDKASASGVHCLKRMAKTIRSRIDGLLAYWSHNRITNASQEGFNNKIGWLTRQAYGYRDEEFLVLKIFDLPNLSIRRKL